ncbi:MAG: glycosyltransferase family 2 protein [Prevotella sp.]|nr:glycosyltransferase family 2 protein [Prevotella sp.]
MSQNTLISVVTPVFNGAEFIKMAYECLKRQTYSRWEWVVVDDGSTDDTFHKLNDICQQDPRVRCLTQPNSGSAKQPRDHAVVESKGDFIIPLDIDDSIDDTYIETMHARIVETGADIVYPEMHFVDLDTGNTIEVLPKAGFDRSKIYDARELVKETLPEWTIGCNGGIYRRCAWINLSWPKPKEEIWMNSDEVDERIYLINAGKAAFSKACYYYLNHQSSITSRVSPKLFHSMKTNRQLSFIIENEFGKDSIEFKKVRQRVFYDWRNKMAVYAKHRHELKASRTEVEGLLKDGFNQLSVDELSWSERFKFAFLANYQFLLFLFRIKYFFSN